MALASRGRAELVRKWKEREVSPERTKVWMEPKGRSSDRKVPVVYYLSRDGHLEHPHFMEVPLSSHKGLHLRDFISRLDLLRGKGMGSMYSWSSKRSYKNGFVWHDLCEEDVIYPADGIEYVLKGSEILNLKSPAGESAVPSSYSSSEKPVEASKSGEIRRKKPAWSSFDISEYKVYKSSDAASEAAGKAADASTQTDDNRPRRRHEDQPQQETAAELERDEISPPPSSPSPETLKPAAEPHADEQSRAAVSSQTSRMRASSVLMHIFSCGSISFKDHGFSIAPQNYRPRVPGGDAPPKDGGGFPSVLMEDREYFSGSLVETKKKAGDHAADLPALKRSNSYNADRGSPAAEEEMDGARARCMPRRPRAAVGKREGICRSAHGSKRINDEPAAATQADATQIADD